MKNFKISNTLYLMLILAFMGCYPTEVHETINRTKHINIETEVVVKHMPNNNEFRVVAIDKCEYIVYNQIVYSMGIGSVGGAGGICHKENCKYCMKRAEQND